MTERFFQAHRDFFHKLSKEKRGILLLDYDGTLAPFRKQRDRAFIAPAIRPILDELIALPSNRVVIISGRALRDLEPLLHLRKIPELWGCHGLERKTSRKPTRGKKRVAAGKPSQVHEKGLEYALRLARIFLPEDRCEVKPFSVACHVRGIHHKKKKWILEGLKRAWEPIERAFDLSMLPFHEGVELRVKTKDKGDAVRTLLSSVPVATPIAYLGDDFTDVAAFRALGKRGLKVLVGRKKISDEFDIWLRGIDDVCLFLRTWLKSIQHEALP